VTDGQACDRDLPPRLYHGTVVDREAPIRAEGIRPTSLERIVHTEFQRQSLGNAYFADSEKTAAFFAVASAVKASTPPTLKEGVVFVIDTKKAMEAGVCFKKTSGLDRATYGQEWTTYDTVPPESIVQTIRTSSNRRRR
jgi:RNA:NAD 2'-phosphotransferase (TPT1/KptA family)